MGVSGAELGLYALRDLPHVSTTLKLRLELAHQRTHGGHALSVDARERLVDQGVDFIDGELGRQEGLNNRCLLYTSPSPRD